MTEPTYKEQTWHWANVTAEHARDLTPKERDDLLAELKKGPPKKPVELPDKSARDMSEQERAEWLSEHKRRWR
jgi:ribosomal protein L29